MAWIEKRTKKTGPRWVVCWNVPGGPEGKPIQKSKSFTIKKEAEEYERKIDSAAYRGLILDADAGCQLFGAYAQAWLRDRQKRDGRKLKLATLTTYEKHLRLYLNPTFEFVELRHITVARVRQWHGEASRRSEAQAKKAYKLLHAIMTTAHHEMGVTIPHIPGLGVEVQTERVLLSDDQVIEFAERVQEKHRAVIYCIAFGALRPPGEIRGLRRMDIDVANLTITVRHNLQEIPKKIIAKYTDIEEPESSKVLGDPKTAAGRRTVSVPDFIMDELVLHMMQFTGNEPTDFVFAGPRRGSQLGLKTFYADFARVKKEMGLDPSITPYNFRHWSLTAAAKTPGMTTKNLMARGGHSSFEAALRYQHAAAEVDRSASDFMREKMAERRRAMRGQRADSRLRRGEQPVDEAVQVPN